MLNRVMLIGRLGADPELRRLESGAVVARFNVATTETYKDKNGEFQELTEWHTIIAWRALAEQAERLFKKGKLVYVEGKLTHRKWQDKDGNDRYTTEINANSMRLLEKREGAGGGYEPAPMPEEDNHQAAAPTSKPASAKSVEDIPASADDDLPF